MPNARGRRSTMLHTLLSESGCGAGSSTPELQIAQSRLYVYTFDPKVGIAYILEALGVHEHHCRLLGILGNTNKPPYMKGARGEARKGSLDSY